MKKLSILTGLALALGNAALTHAQDAAHDAGTSADVPVETAPASSDLAATPATAAPVEAALPAPDAALYTLPAAEAAPAELSQAELEALGFGTGEDAPTVDTNLKVFGFADFSTKAFLPRNGQWSGNLAPHRSFYIGNFNLYISKNLSDKWRTMGEVRFTYLPNGAGTSNNPTATTSTLVADYNDFNRNVKWGGIIIQRVYLEYSAFKYMNIRVGQFLTPYGIWNVDHGSPTYIPVQRPFVIGSNWFPERQTGFEVFGRYDLSLANSVGYHATLSNGQGLASEYADWDNNKAVGGRLFWDNHRMGDLRVGVSGFYGTLTDATPTIGFANGQTVFGQKNSLQYHNLAFAADAQWKYKSLHLQTEALFQQVDHTRNGRTLIANATTGVPTYPADYTSWGAYFLAAYRLPWFGITPYETVQWIDQHAPGGTLKFHMINLETGINIRLIDSVVLKGAYGWAHFPGGIDLVTRDNLHMIIAQLAWAF